MQRATVDALAPGIRHAAYDARAESAACRDAALALLQYTPELALAQSNTLLLEVTASLSLFGGPLRIQRHVRLSLLRLGLSAVLSLAPTAQGAWLLANGEHARRRRVMRLKSLAACLDGLPCDDLPAAAPYLAWLHGMGCRNLGTLRALPRAGLKRRCGVALVQCLDQAYGREAELFEWFTPPSAFRATFESMERLEHEQAVLHIAQRLVEQLCGWLNARRRAVSRLVFSLHHERGRHAIPATPVALALGAPAWQSEHLHALLREHMSRIRLAAHVIAVTLDAPVTEPRAPAPQSLFPDPGDSMDDRRRVLELLIARLGHDHVLQPAPVADHRPERANRWAPLHHAAHKAKAALPHPLRPFWLLPKPIALPIRRHRPVYGTPLRIISGPERIEDGWWDEGLTLRDYFIAEAEDGSRYWLFQERADNSGWFLHGLFA